MHILSGKDIQHLAIKHDFTQVIEQAALNAGSSNLQLPEREQIAAGNSTHLLMPVYEKAYFSTSLLSVTPGNSNTGSDTFQGMVSLNSSETGSPLCLLNGTAVQGLRMGALSGVGYQYLAPAGASVLGIVGAGVQGYYQGLLLAREKGIEKIILFDKDLWKAEQMVEKLKQETSVSDISAADEIEHLLMESNVVVTATSSEQPVLPNDKMLLNGKTYIATGSFKPNMTELPKALFPHLKKCVVDTRTALRESGDLIEPVINSRLHIDNVITLAEYISAKKPPELGRTRLFKAAGSALFDLYLAREIYRLARENRMGTVIDF